MASGSDIPIRTDTDILIRTMGAGIPIGPTDIMDRRPTTARHFIGTVAIAFTIRGHTIGTITGAGSKLRGQEISEAGG